MHSKTLVLSLVLALTPGLLAGQTLVDGARTASGRPTGALKGTFEGTAGSTLQGGDVQSASVGFSPTPWVTLLVQGERFHVPTRHSTFDNGRGSSITRGFTTLVLGGEVRVGIPTSGRVSGYAALGIGGGAWGSNVDEFSRERDSGPVWAGNVGGGVRIRIRRNLSVVADARLAIAIAGESVLGYVPIRGGLAWDF